MKLSRRIKRIEVSLPGPRKPRQDYAALTQRIGDCNGLTVLAPEEAILARRLKPYMPVIDRIVAEQTWGFGNE